VIVPKETQVSTEKNLGPYESLRDYLGALEARGHVVHIAEVDQDTYEATGLIYRLIESCGWTGAPILIFDRIKVDGRWIDGPLVANLYGRWEYDALAFGCDPAGRSAREAFRMALKQVISLAGEDGQWKTVEPRMISTSDAPCKEIVQIGEEVDILGFPFIQSNPADGGRYINTGNVVLEHPNYGRNVGTYRCQIKGPRKIAVNPLPNQHGWTFLTDMKDSGEPFAKAAVVLGADPIVFAMSSSKTARLGQDELALAGGFLGKSVEVVKCQTSDMLVPAHAEMIIEGEIPFDLEPEGPFGEMFGYVGPGIPENFYMNITAVTCRRNPIIVNHFSGVTRGFLTSPLEATINLRFKQLFPNLVAIHLPLATPGFCVVSIDKNAPGDGLRAGRKISEDVMLAKITIVVDEDVDIYDPAEVMRTVGARWQPHPASEIIEEARGSSTDPSLAARGVTSKIVIDATRQLPREGGPEHYAIHNRDALLEGQPDIFARVDEKWSTLVEQLKHKV
jgi:UbiD family decarboxylase